MFHLLCRHVLRELKVMNLGRSIAPANILIIGLALTTLAFGMSRSFASILLTRALGIYFLSKMTFKFGISDCLIL